VLLLDESLLRHVVKELEFARATDDWGMTNTSAAASLVVLPLTLTVVSGPQTNGQFHLSFQGQPGRSYVLETSTNLQSWRRVLTNLPVNGMFDFIDTNAADPQRYYRATQ
jgi:hypothetical protein